MNRNWIIESAFLKKDSLIEYGF